MTNRIKQDIVFDAGLCLLCKHFSFKKNDQRRWICTAFPNGMPKEITDGKFDHRKPHPNDNGTRFEIKEGYTLPDWVEEDFQRFVDDEAKSDEQTNSDNL